MFLTLSGEIGNKAIGGPYTYCCGYRSVQWYISKYHGTATVFRESLGFDFVRENLLHGNLESFVLCALGKVKAKSVRKFLDCGVFIHMCLCTVCVCECLCGRDLILPAIIS